MQLCMMTGPKFVSLELGSLVELQAGEADCVGALGGTLNRDPCSLWGVV